MGVPVPCAGDLKANALNIYLQEQQNGLVTDSWLGIESSYHRAGTVRGWTASPNAGVAFC